jgi:ferredoxin
MRIVVDRERCVGAGQCVLAAPEVFDQSEDDGRVLLRPDADADRTPAPAAVDLCPSRALSLVPE